MRPLLVKPLLVKLFAEPSKLLVVVLLIVWLLELLPVEPNKDEEELPLLPPLEEDPDPTPDDPDMELDWANASPVASISQAPAYSAGTIVRVCHFRRRISMGLSP